MKKNITTILSLVIVLALAFALRFYQLGLLPDGLYVDEASIGYSAFSVLNTGKDEFGKSFPIVFRSFIAFQAPLYIYLSILPVYLFGLSEYSIRFTSAISGVMTIGAMYFLVYKLSPRKKALLFAFLSALILAISPWHNALSRAVFESNVSTLFLLLGVIFFYKSLNYLKSKKFSPFFLLPSALFFGLSINTYLAQRVLVPIIVLALFFQYRQILLTVRFRKSLIASILLGTLLLVPTISIVFTSGFAQRASISIFTSESAGIIAGAPLDAIVNNRVFLLFRQYLSLYFTYLSPKSLFLLGDPDQRVSYPYLGAFYIWQFPFFIFGLYSLTKDKFNTGIKYAVLLLLFASPVAAAMTGDPFHTVRAHTLTVPVSVVIAYGLYKTYIWLSRKFGTGQRRNFVRLAACTLILTVTSFSILKLWSSAAILHPHYSSQYWNYGYKEMVDIIRGLEDLPIIVDNSRGEPYSELLFFLRFDPDVYQRNNFEVSLDQYYSDLSRNKQKYIGKIVTRPINWEKDLLVEQYLIGDHLSISERQIKEHELELVKEIYYPDRNLAFRIVKTKK